MKHVPPGVTSAPRPLGPCESRCPPSPSAAASDWRGRASHDMWKILYFLVIFGGLETEFHGSGSILAMFSRFWKLLDGFHPHLDASDGFMRRRSWFRMCCGVQMEARMLVMGPLSCVSSADPGLKVGISTYQALNPTGRCMIGRSRRLSEASAGISKPSMSKAVA